MARRGRGWRRHRSSRSRDAADKAAGTAPDGRSQLPRAMPVSQATTMAIKVIVPSPGGSGPRGPTTANPNSYCSILARTCQ